MTDAKTIEKGGYIEAVGRRKTAIARVRISNLGGKKVTVNNRKLEDYFPIEVLRKRIFEPFDIAPQSFDVSAHVKGGGVSSQADAIRHGITRTLVLFDSENRSALKQKGLLKRDPRAKERKKPGLKKARKAPQWSKR